MSNDEPIVLSVGTEVSAKYKGAFCEAKIKKVNRSVRVKVTIKSDSNSITIDEADIVSGTARVGQTITIKHSESASSNTCESIVNKIFDQSFYTVVFDDGDEATLKRTSLCLKSGKHFAESDTLDQLPLTHPEHFSSPVSLGRRCRRKQTSIAAAAAAQNRRKKAGAKVTKKSKAQLDVGKIVRVEYGDKRGSKNKDIWFPAVVVSVKLDTDDTILYKVRSFCDDRFYDVQKQDATVIDKEIVLSTFQDEDISSELEDALQKTITYLDTGKIPDNWDALCSEADDSSDNNQEESFATSTRSSAAAAAAAAAAKKSSEDDDDDDLSSYEESESDTEDTDANRDAFHYGLYSFFVDSKISLNMSTDLGTINGKDIDLYKLYRTVNYLGGYNRINNRNEWKKVYNKIAFGKTSVDGKELASSVDKDIVAQYNHLKSIYKKYLHAFHELHRKLGTDPVRDSCSNWNKSRPSRGERKERARLNSVSSASSSFVAPSAAAAAATPGCTTSTTTGGAGARRNSNKTTVKSEPEVNTGGSSTPLPVAEATPTTVAAAAATTTTSSTVATPAKQTAKEKPEDKKRKKKTKEVEPQQQQPPTPLARIPEKQIKSESDNDDSQLTNSSMFDGFSDEEIDATLALKDSNVNPKDIFVGDCLSVLYGKGKQVKLYDAKVLKIQETSGKMQFFVHYYGWSSRYDEWVHVHRINRIIKDKSPRRRTGKVKNKGEPLPESALAVPPKEKTPEPSRTRKASIKSESGKESKVTSTKKQQQQQPETPEHPPRRSRTLSFTKREKRLTEEKPVTPGKRSVKTEMANTPPHATTKAKATKSTKKSSESDDDSQSATSRSSSKSEKRKEVEKPNRELEVKKAKTKESKRKVDRADSTVKQEDTPATEVEEKRKSTENLSVKTETVEIIDKTVKVTDVYQFEEQSSEATSAPVAPVGAASKTSTDADSDDSKSETKSTPSIEFTEKPSVELASLNTQNESLITENTTDISLQSESEDLEVQKILACNENSEDLLEEKPKRDEVSDVVIKISSEDIDLDRSSPGQLVVAEDDEENEEAAPHELDEDKKEPVEAEKPKISTDSEDDKSLAGPVEPKSEPELTLTATAGDIPSLLCEETVPASPPSSPLSPPSPQYPAHNLTIDTDQSISSSPAFEAAKSSEHPQCLSHHQPFSSLIAAASQQSLAIQANKFTNEKGAECQMTNLNMDIRNKISDLNDDDNLDEDDDLDGEDDQVDGVEADVDEFDDEHFFREKERGNYRKSKIVDRKRRTSRKGSKCTSNLSSQESSQDGDENVFDDFNKLAECATFHKHSKTHDMKDDDDSGDSNQRGDKRPSMSPAPSPKKRRRGRMRTISQSESRDSITKERTPTFKTRGRYRHMSGHSHSELASLNQSALTYSPRDSLSVRGSRENSCSIDYSRMSPITVASMSAIARKYSCHEPQEPDSSILYTSKPSKFKYNFLTPFPEGASVDDKCEELLRRLHQIQSIYNEIRSEHATMDRKRKRAMQKLKEKKEKEKQEDSKQGESAGMATTPGLSTATNSGSESSSSKNERRSSRREQKQDENKNSGDKDEEDDKDDHTTNDTLKDDD